MEFSINWIRLNLEIGTIFFLEVYSFTLHKKKIQSTQTTVFSQKYPVIKFVNIPCSGIGNVSISKRPALMCRTMDGPLSSQWVRMLLSTDLNPRQWLYMQQESDDLSKLDLFLASYWQLALAAVRWTDWIIQQLSLGLQGNMDKQP